MADVSMHCMLAILCLLIVSCHATAPSKGAKLHVQGEMSFKILNTDRGSKIREDQSNEDVRNKPEIMPVITKNGQRSPWDPWYDSEEWEKRKLKPWNSSGEPKKHEHHHKHNHGHHKKHHHHRSSEYYCSSYENTKHVKIPWYDYEESDLHIKIPWYDAGENKKHIIIPGVGNEENKKHIIVPGLGGATKNRWGPPKFINKNKRNKPQDEGNIQKEQHTLNPGYGSHQNKENDEGSEDNNRWKPPQFGSEEEQKGVYHQGKDSKDDTHDQPGWLRQLWNWFMYKIKNRNQP